MMTTSNENPDWLPIRSIAIQLQVIPSQNIKAEKQGVEDKNLRIQNVLISSHFIRDKIAKKKGQLQITKKFPHPENLARTIWYGL